ncbi:MAG: hypothetical protein IJD92_02625 [Bacilli bacterium]|nr:hypothetical protein [Bacilli bacterium]
MKVEKKDKKMKRLSKSKVKTIVITVEELEKLSAEKQLEKFEEIFDKIYSGEEVESIRKYALRCVKLTCDPKDNKVHLPYGVLVQKKDNDIIIKLYNNRHIFLFLLFLTLLFFALLGSSYSVINYNIIKNFNKDIDGDKIPDINLELTGDRKSDINIDINNDDKPDLNIDYAMNREPIFNRDRNHDGKADHNLMNQDLNQDGKCDLNCDINNDGWPDININFDGNKKPNMHVDIDGDGKPDLNFDTNGDMKCDLHCDTNEDKVCDKWCLTTPELDNMDHINSGTSNTVGNKDVFVQSGELVLEYEEDNTVYITDIYPDDQPYYVQDIPTKKFKVTNKSNLYIKYNLRWVITLNDYVSDNFKYKVTSSLNTLNTDWITAPKLTSPMSTEILINPHTTQEFEIDFKLQGIGGKQNYDQGKTFAGYIEIYLDNEF